MRNSSSTKKAHVSTSRSHLHWILTAALLPLIGIAAFLVFTPQVATKMKASSDTGLSLKTAITPAVKVTNQPTVQTPGTLPGLTGKQTGSQGKQNETTALATATPTLLSSTPQTTQLGVFSLTEGGPLPVPETILHPTNIARLMLNSTLVSVYAGSMAQNPQAGILCVLQENLTTGQLNLQVYQDPRADGPLTILAIQNTKLKLTDTTSEGYFDLTTNQFQW